MSVESLFNNFVEYFESHRDLVEGIAIADKDEVKMFHRFVPDRPRNIYSHTKSFASLAIGDAMVSGKLSLDDKPSEFFPEYMTADTDPLIGRITLGDLLTMRSGFGDSYLMRNSRCDACPDYLSFMFSKKMKNEPGTKFTYSNGDTYIASRMFEKVMGKTLELYLYERMFRHINIGFPVWEHDPQGHTFPATGLYLKLTDQLKLGQIILGEGKYHGTSVADYGYIKEATTNKIDRFKNGEGYGYQFWIYSDEYSAFRADGSYGQITAISPKSGLLVSIQAPEYGNITEVMPYFNELVKNL